MDKIQLSKCVIYVVISHKLKFYEKGGNIIKNKEFKVLITISFAILIILSANIKPNVASAKTTRIGKVTTAVLNVRKRATTSSSILTQVRKNQSYEILSTSGKWHKIKANGKTGWVHGDYMSVSTSSQTSGETIRITTDVLRVRQRATTSSSILTRVRKNQEFNTLDKSGKWYKIRANSKTGWVHGDYVTVVKGSSKPNPKPDPKPDKPQSGETIRITTDVLRVRQRATTSSSILTRVRKNQEFKTLGKSGKWYKINANGKTGWVHGDYTKVIKESSNPEDPKDGDTIRITTDVLRVRQRATTSSSILTRVRKNQEFKTLDKSGKWYKINANGKTGWVHGDYVIVVKGSSKPDPKPEEPEPLPAPKIRDLSIKGGEYVGESHTITADASSKNGVLYKFTITDLSNNKKTVIRDYDKSNKITWIPDKAGKYSYEVRVKDTKAGKDDKRVSVSKDISIKEVPPAKVTSLNIDGSGYTTDTHTIRAKASSQNRVLYQFRIKDLTTGKTQTIQSYSTSNTVKWTPDKAGRYEYRVDVKDEHSNKSRDDRESEEINIYNYIYYSTSQYGKSLEDMVREQQRRNPQTDSYGGGWKTAKAKDVEKYLNPDNFLQFTPESSEIVGQTAQITANPRLNVRSGPSTNYGVLTQVNLGESYKVLEVSNGWYKINANGKNGWISGSYTNVKGKEVKIKAVQVTTDVLNVRQKATTSSNVLTQVRLNDVYIVQGQSNGWYKISANGKSGWISGDYTKLSNTVPQQMYQFLVLSGSSGITASELNIELKGKGILEGHGQAFLDAGEKHNINEIYLLSHAFLETGHGKSQLANGIRVTTVDGKSVKARTVYNMFGIGAYDRDPLRLGAEYAYKEGWFTPEEAIIGGTKFIAEQYVNNPNYKQDTLYKMRWNPEDPGNHQYATDIGWASKQTGRMDLVSDIANRYGNVVLRFDIPLYSTIAPN